jgi:predicted Abi (CAAX) family protease
MIRTDSGPEASALERSLAILLPALAEDVVNRAAVRAIAKPVRIRMVPPWGFLLAAPQFLLLFSMPHFPIRAIILDSTASNDNPLDEKK